MSVDNNSIILDLCESISRHFQKGEDALVCLRHAPSPYNVSRKRSTPLPSGGEGEVPRSPDSAPPY